MRYGMNLLLWTDTIDETALPLMEEIQQIGFDVVELPIFDYDVDKYARLGKHLDKAGLARGATAIRGADDNPMSPDPAVRRQGIANSKANLDCGRPSGPRS